jgi:hypothetical protein
VRLDLSSRPDGDDRAPTDADGAVFHEADAGAGHGEEMAPGYQRVEHDYSIT